MKGAIRDLPVVAVEGGNLEAALRQFKKRVDAGGYLRTLKARANNPSKADRRRFKDHKAATRRRKTEAQQRGQERKRRALHMRDRTDRRQRPEGDRRHEG